MTRFLLSVFALFLYSATTLRSQNLLLPLLADSTHFIQYDDQGGEQLVFKNWYEYNAQDLAINLYSTSSWVGSKTYYWSTYVYNAENLLDNYTTYNSTISAAGPWSKFLREEDEYDAQGRNTYFFGQYGSNDTWIDYYRANTGYDDTVPSDSLYYELWDDASQTWGYNYRNLNQYLPNDPNHTLTHYQYDNWDASNNLWKPYVDDSYQFDVDGRLAVYTNKTYTPGLSLRVDSFIYRNDLKIDTVYKFIEIGSLGFVNKLFVKYNYDNDGNLSNTYQFRWNEASGTWEPSTRTEYQPGDGILTNDFAYERTDVYNAGTQTYVPNNEITRQFTALNNNHYLYVERNSFSNGQGGLKLTSQDSTWYFLSTVGTQTPQAPASVDCVFSNPFVPSSCVVCNAIDKDVPMQLRITDLNGRVVASASVMPGTSWRPNMVAPAGMYVLSVWQGGRYLGQKRMMVVR